MKIVGVEEAPGNPRKLSVVVPFVDEAADAKPVEVRVGRDVGMTDDLADELTRELDVDVDALSETISSRFGTSEGGSWSGPPLSLRDTLRGDMVRAELGAWYRLPSSVLQGTDLWQVNDVTPAGRGTRTISFGRLGLSEIECDIPSKAALSIEPGQMVFGAKRLLQTRKKLLGFVSVDIEFVPDAEPPTRIPILLPLVRIHRPRRKGCEATYVFATETAKDAEGTIEVLGLGGGGGFKITIAYERGYTARTHCVEHVMPAVLELQAGTTLVDGTDVAYGLRATVTDPGTNSIEVRKIPPASDGCGRPETELAGMPMKERNLVHVPRADSFSEKFRLVREVRGKVALGLELTSPVPIKLGFDYVRSSTQEASIETALTPGGRYLAYGPSPARGATLEQQLEICWTTGR